MSIQISDPLQLLPYQIGLLAPPLEDGAAQGQNLLTTAQRSIVLGEPVPIVFCRRVSGNGGVFVSPGATEGRYANDPTTNALTVNLQLVLSEGELPQLQERDLYQRNCRVGTWAQTYNRRAGTWTPGNFIVAVAGKDPWACPQYCGTSGNYANLTTLSYTNTHQDRDGTWDKQVHAFVRQGIKVTRILDSTLGPSNNIVDLALYLIKQSSRLPNSMLDTAAFTTAANFTNVNSFFYNGEFKESTNLEDWLQEISSKFLLRVSDNLGKKGMRPLLPINNDYTIKTTAIAPSFTFTEDHVLPDGFQIEYIPLSERKPICALILWRQQPDSDVGIVRTAEVRFAGEAVAGPYEQYDLSQFCTTENHAIKVGTYYVARRKYITHTLRLKARPDTYNSTLVLGDIVRVRLQRETVTGSIAAHDFYYEVERINKSISGIVELDLMHCPVDSQNRSLVALAVAAATGAGYTLPTGRNDFSCNINNDTDPVPDEGGNLPDLPDPGDPDDPGSGPDGGGDFGYNIPPGTETSPSGTDQNPEYPESYGEINGASGPTGQPVVDDTLSADGTCPGAFIEKIQEGSELFNYTITNADVDFEIVGIGRCPDPSTPSGYGDSFVIGQTDSVEPNLSSYNSVRWTGTVVQPSSTFTLTSLWVPIASGDFVTIGGLIEQSTSARYADNGVLRGPAVGPVPWRASVSWEQYAYGFSPQSQIGGLGKNGNSGLGDPYNGPFGAADDNVSPNPFLSGSISGEWELSSDNGSSTALSWQGRDS
jgi:hypothetical protein